MSALSSLLFYWRVLPLIVRTLSRLLQRSMGIGGALALGLFLGTGRLSPGGDKKVLEATRQLHNRFKAAFGSACCRILMKTKESAIHNHDCAQRTAGAAEFTAALILAQRPEVSQRINWNYLNQNDRKIGARLKIIANRLIK